MLEEEKRPGLPVLVLHAVHPSTLNAGDGGFGGADQQELCFHERWNRAKPKCGNKNPGDGNAFLSSPMAKTLSRASPSDVYSSNNEKDRRSKRRGL